MVEQACSRARAASRILATLPRARKDAALLAIAGRLALDQREILAANAEDVAAARARETKEALVDRLLLDEERLASIAASVREIAELPDPVGQVIAESIRPSGLVIQRVRVPIGVIAMIYEARPNVTVEASALTLKSGNAVVLRGGSDAARTNAALARSIALALQSSGVPEGAVEVLEGGRESVKALVGTPGLVDVAIPRGGEGLIREVAEHARVPLILHYKGVCHLYVDRGADAEMATRIVVNSKLSRPGVCNALECLLVDEADAARLVPPIAGALLHGGCELRGDEKTREIVPLARAAKEEDYGREFLDPIIAIRIVRGLDGALEHIARYGSQHTEAIVTPSEANAARFRNEVDAACVVVNASTRFHDGGELGLGAEIGIATSRLHWRGPMGLEALTTMKWIVTGHGQIR
jgi:glutamate-5-semialdehyde dehydrogenase